MTEFLADIADADVAILANGAMPCGDAVEILHHAHILVACDGAVENALSLGRVPDFVVGDGDSTSDSKRDAMGERFVCVDEQETNDLAKAFRFSCARFPEAKTIVVLGAHGLRDDHFIGNVSLLPDLAEESASASVSMVTESGRFDVVLGRRTFRTHVGEPVSVFAFRAGVGVVSDGLVWPLEGVRLDALWRGALNRADKETVTLAADGPIVVYRPVPARNRS